MRIQYESQIESLTDDLRQQRKKKSSTELPVGSGYLNKGIATVPLEEIRTFAHAKEKIQSVFPHLL